MKNANLLWLTTTLCAFICLSSLEADPISAPPVPAPNTPHSSPDTPPQAKDKDAASSSLQSTPVAPGTTEPAKNAEASIIRVHSTNQSYDYIKPWEKNNPYERHGLGAVLPNNRILVSADLIANHTYISLEKIESEEKAPAQVLSVDYEANLALLAPDDSHPNFLKNSKPFKLATGAVTGDHLRILQLESNDTLVTTTGPITTVQVGNYTLDNANFLIYRVSALLQYRDNSFTTPAIDSEGRLAGMLMRYDPRNQTLDIIPAPVIAHFLKDFEEHTGHYLGFPSAGIEYSPLRDPQLRHYAKVPESETNKGIYITNVAPNGPAAKAGVQVGDVLLEIAGQSIDADGNYKDPQYGKISLSYLLTTKHTSGQNIPIKIARQGEIKDLTMNIFHRPAQSYVIPPYSIDIAPRYYIAGGLVFQELSREYLKSWGNEWRKRAPQYFVYLDQYQDELLKDENQKRVVILSIVLPAASNIGYEELSAIPVKAINGHRLNDLNDVPKALADVPANGYHHIEFDGYPTEIYLNAAHLAEDDQQICNTYGIPWLSR